MAGSTVMERMHGTSYPADSGFRMPPSLPYALRFSQVESITSKTGPSTTTVVVVAAVAAFFVAMGLWAISAQVDNEFQAAAAN